MRVIQRKNSEAVVVFTEQGNPIRVTVLTAPNEVVNLGFEFPPGVAVAKAEDVAQLPLSEFSL